MRKFETEIIRRRDAQGRLVAAGLSWVEIRYGVHVACAVTFWLGLYFAVVLLIWCFLAGGKPPFIALAEGCGLVALSALVMIYRRGTRERALVFHADYIELPRGQPRDGERRQLPIAITDVANIEVWRGGDEFWLLLYTRSADAHVLGRGLNEFQARKVVALLSGARDDLRESLAQAKSDQPSARRIIN